MRSKKSCEECEKEEAGWVALLPITDENALGIKIINALAKRP
jgi:hypothetical protein